MEEKLTFIDSEYLKKNGFREVEDKSGNRYVREDISVLFEVPDEKMSINVGGALIDINAVEEKELRGLLGDRPMEVKCLECGGEVQAFCDLEGIYEVKRSGDKLILKYLRDNCDYRGEPKFYCKDCGRQCDIPGEVEHE